MTRVAAIGDIHVGADPVGRVAAGLTLLGERADMLLLAGDLTRTGTVEEAALDGRRAGRRRDPGRGGARQP